MNAKIQTDYTGESLAMKRCLIIFLCLFHIFFSGNISAQQSIDLVTVDNFKPFRWLEDNRLIGIDIDILTELGKRIDVTFNIRIVPWARLINMVQQGDIHGAFSANKTHDRENFAHFIEVPLHQSYFSIFVLEGNQFKFDDITDLYGKRIGKIRGFSISKEFDQAVKSNKINIHEINSTEQYFNLVKIGRIDAFVAAHYPSLYELNTLGLSESIVPLPKPASKIKQAYLMISKEAELKNRISIINNLNNALNHMLKDGTIDNINAKYLEN